MTVNVRRVALVALLAALLAALIVAGAGMNARLHDLEQRQPVQNVFIDGELVEKPAPTTSVLSA